MKKLTLLLVVVCFAGGIYAQGLKFGFKTGMTLSQFSGPSEQANGMDLEANSNTGGFMVGAIVRYNITELFGVKTEVLYNQKGTKYNFSGEGYQYLPPASRAEGNQIFFTGDQRIDLDISNSYLNFPIMLFGRVGRFEFEGGVSIGLLLSSRASGELQIDAITSSGTSAGEYIGFLDFKYNDYGNRPQGFTSADVTTLNVDGQMITFPNFLDTYYQFRGRNGTVISEDNDRVFNALDFGVVGGINYYWNSTLYLGARLNYGLSDITNNESGYDVSKVDATEPVRDDKDRNIAIQLSLGFNF